MSATLTLRQVDIGTLDRAIIPRPGTSLTHVAVLRVKEGRLFWAAVHQDTEAVSIAMYRHTPMGDRSAAMLTIGFRAAQELPDNATDVVLLYDDLDGTEFAYGMYAWLKT